MKTKLAWAILGFLLLCTFALTFFKSPEEIKALLTTVAGDLKPYSVFVHILFIVVLVLGFFLNRMQSMLFFLFIAFLSLSATVVSVVYAIIPNIIIFAAFSVLIVQAFAAKNLNFSFEKDRSVDLMFGIVGLLFGFWYLHWVEDPIWLNALFFSPLGAVNCPTMVTICGFLCLSRQPRSLFLETAVGLTTLYFGFFGLFRLGAYVDIVLIACALFLLARLTACMTRDALVRESALPK